MLEQPWVVWGVSSTYLGAVGQTEALLTIQLLQLLPASGQRLVVVPPVRRRLFAVSAYIFHCSHFSFFSTVYMPPPPPPTSTFR